MPIIPDRRYRKKQVPVRFSENAAENRWLYGLVGFLPLDIG
jgi:hypothetical protein